MRSRKIPTGIANDAAYANDLESVGHVLTVHHLDGDKANCAGWNISALCQRCHLKIQGRVKMDQLFFLEVLPISGWILPHYEGYLKSQDEKRSVTEQIL